MKKRRKENGKRGGRSAFKDRNLSFWASQVRPEQGGLLGKEQLWFFAGLTKMCLRRKKK